MRILFFGGPANHAAREGQPVFRLLIREPLGQVASGDHATNRPASSGDMSNAAG